MEERKIDPRIRNRELEVLLPKIVVAGVPHRLLALWIRGDEGSDSARKKVLVAFSSL